MPPELTQQEIELRIYEQASPCDARPYPNEHAARLKPPENFAQDTFRRSSDGTIYGSIKVPATADVIWAKLKGKAEKSDPVHPQAIRFPTKDWTEAQAKKWLTDNNVKYILFEPASGGKNRLLTEVEKRDILDHLHTRDLPLDRSAIDKEKRTVGMSFSSEMPVLRWYGFEILSHKAEHIRMDRWKAGAAFLMDHNPRDQRGIIQEGKLNEKAMVEGTALISRHQRGEELWMDIQDGIRRYTSIGYALYDLREMKPDEMSQELQQACLQNKCGAYISEDWELLEGSSVAIPADTSVGVGRSLEEFFVKRDQQYQPPASDSHGAAETTTIHQRGASMQDEKDKNLTPAPLTEEQQRALEAERVKEITETGKRFESRIAGGKEKMDLLVRDAVELKRSFDLFRGDVYLRITDSKPLETPISFLDMPEKDKKRYSFRNAIISLMKRHDPGIRDIHGTEIDTSFEEECSREVGKKISPSARGGIHIPYDVQAHRSIITPDMVPYIRASLANRGLSMRDLTVGSATAGGNLVATNLLASSFIDLLRNRALAFRIGVQHLPGLVGNVAFPWQTGAGTFYWVAENAAPASESAVTFDQVTLTPNEGGMYMDYSRRLLIQSTPGIDLLVQNDISQGCALGIDKSVFHGSGGTQPTGIAATSSIGDVDGAGFGFEQGIEFETDVATGNGDIGTMAFVMGAPARGLLKGRLAALNTAERVIDRDGRMNGYPVFMTNQIDAGYIFFGVWSQALVGEWGTLDLLVDPYTGGKEGTIRVRAFITVDVGVLQPTAFSVCSNLS